MSKNFYLLISVFLIGLGVCPSSGVTLFIAEKLLSTHALDLRVVSRSKRDAVSSLMARYYDVTMDFDGKQIKLRLKRQDVIAHLVGQGRVYKRDWATYASAEVEGVFVVHRYESTHFRLKIEGYMVHELTPFLVQPQETSDGHVIHKLHQRAINESLSNDPRHKRRRRREYGLLDGRSLYLNTKVITDVTMRELVSSRVADHEVDFYIQQYYAMLITFVNQRFNSLRNHGTNIYFIGNGLQILKTPIPGVADAAQVTSDQQRKTTCAKTLAEKFDLFTQYEYADQMMLLTGYDMLSSNGRTKQAISKVNSGCLPPGARSLVRFNMTVDFFRVAAHASMIGFGVKTDGLKGDPIAEKCDKASSYIMAGGERNPFSVSLKYREEWWLYSECTNEMLRRYLATVSKNRWTICLRELKVDPEASFLGYRMTLQRQCQLFSGRGAIYNVGDGNICGNGVTCMMYQGGKLKYERYLPLPGTSCGHGKWCVGRACLDIPYPFPLYVSGRK